VRDLKSPAAIWAKGILFLVVGLGAGALLLFEAPTARTALLLVLTVWAFCRAYYFAFHVLGHYVDPEFRFPGLGSFVRCLVRQRRGGPN
jgi:hypothetical protein